MVSRLIRCVTLVDPIPRSSRSVLQSYVRCGSVGLYCWSADSLTAHCQSVHSFSAQYSSAILNRRQTVSSLSSPVYPLSSAQITSHPFLFTSSRICRAAPLHPSVTMRVLSLLVLVLCASLATAIRHSKRAVADSDAAPAPAYPTTYIWPMPQNVSQGAKLRTVSYPLTIGTYPSFPDLDAAIARFTDVTFQHRATGDPGTESITSVEVEVQDINVPLQLGVDESYTLHVSSTYGVTIHATTYYGALHGLETLSQLITYNFTTSVYQIAGAPWSIQDQPRYPHRGVLVDTSRHYQTIPVIKKIVDSLAYSKYNVFHWHLSDIQSFPYQSDVLPLLANAAYSNNDRYSSGDVADIVEYARQRGVRVMMEFDIPGHAGSWCVGYPSVCPSPTCNMPLDPSSPDTFDVMESLFTEITGGSSRKGLVPEDLIHLGGDEVDLSCWTQVDRVKQWLSNNNMTDRDAYRYMVERAHGLVYKAGRTPINWDEVWYNFGKTIDPQTIIHVWRDEEYVYNATRDGFRVLVSPDGPWYLDGLQTSWQDMYKLEPESGITDATQKSLILGGEGCMWGETVDASVILPTIWPRAAAIAERLWSPKSVADTAAAQPRYAYFRCLLNRRGIGAGPSGASTARQAPDGPGGCLEQ